MEVLSRRSTKFASSSSSPAKPSMSSAKRKLVIVLPPMASTEYHEQGKSRDNVRLISSPGSVSHTARGRSGHLPWVTEPRCQKMLHPTPVHFNPEKTLFNVSLLSKIMDSFKVITALVGVINKNKKSEETRDTKILIN